MTIIVFKSGAVIETDARFTAIQRSLSGEIIAADIYNEGDDKIQALQLADVSIILQRPDHQKGGADSIPSESA